MVKNLQGLIRRLLMQFNVPYRSNLIMKINEIRQKGILNELKETLTAVLRHIFGRAAFNYSFLQSFEIY